MREGLSLHELAVRLAEIAEDICDELLPGGRVIGHEYRASSVYGGAGKKRGGSLAVELRGPKRGLWIDGGNPEEHSGDMLDLVACSLQCQIGEAAKWARDRLGLDPGTSPARRRRRDRPREFSGPGATAVRDNNPAAEVAKRESYALRIWQRGTSIQGTLGEAYFRARGITAALPPTLGFIGELAHKPSGLAYPAVVAAVCGPDKTITGIWRIWIAEQDGIVGKAPVAPVRMGLGSVIGRSVWLGPRGPRFAVCEGIETGLAIAQALPDLPVWVALSAVGLRKIRIPDWIKEVVIFPDEDEPSRLKNGKIVYPGQDAAAALKARLLREGKRVRVVRCPRKGMDFNDRLNEEAP
jgi:hypothetical protein